MSHEKIIKIETIIPDTIMQGLVLLRIHTDSGFIGNGESYYIPESVASVVHDWMAQRLLGANALDVESHWRFLYERSQNFGGKGAEMRALSAIDLALWDILGKCCQQPIWQLLGGKVRERMPVYNSSGGCSYGRNAGVAKSGHGWPGMGDMGKPGPLEDNWASRHSAGDYAEELVKEGYKGVKVWALDELAHTSNGSLYLNRNELRKFLKPLHEIRERVGFDLEIMFDGHGFFQWPAAMRIAEELRDIKLLWAEDIIRPDCIDTIARFREASGIPIAASEMFSNREDYRLILERGGADYIMIDPTWIGGISETRRITHMANAYNIPVTMHDCTGPLTLFSGLHVALSSANVVFQETVRAHIRCMYDALIDQNVVIEQGEALPPTGPGLGTNLLPELFTPGQHDYRVSSL